MLKRARRAVVGEIEVEEVDVDELEVDRVGVKRLDRAGINPAPTFIQSQDIHRAAARMP